MALAWSALTFLTGTGRSLLGVLVPRVRPVGAAPVMYTREYACMQP